MERKTRIISNERARELALRYREGTDSDLHDLSRSGQYVVRRALYYRMEVWRKLEPEYGSLRDKRCKDSDKPLLHRLLRWLARQEQVAGVVVAEKYHPLYGYTMPVLEEANGCKVDALWLPR